jgi:ribosome-binding factor A
MTKAPSPRMRKINESVREVIADEITLLTDPGLGFVTITGVQTSPDLRNATVFYSAMGDERQRGDSAAALARSAPHLQAALAGQVRLKYTPRLRFEVDDAIETGLRISEVLRRLDDEGGDDVDE